MIRRADPPPRRTRFAGDGISDALDATERSHPLETGGILLGWREPDAVVVAGALEVPDVGATPHRYHRHHDSAQAALARALATQASDSPLGYVGEWHSHPADVPPSRQDRREITAISRQSLDPVTLIVIAGVPGRLSTFALNGRRGRVTCAAAVEEEKG